MRVGNWSTRGHASKSAMRLSFRRWMAKRCSRANIKAWYGETPGKILKARRMVLR